MSCISQLLKLKGDKSFLPTPNPSIVIEGGGEYRNYEYLITFTNLGHRCGYVAIDNDHPCYGKNLVYEDEYGIDVHGGVTFHQNEVSLKELLSSKCEDEWIGFDAAHWNDTADYNLARQYFGEESEYLRFMQTNSEPFHGDQISHKTFSYMEKECQHLIDQLISVKESRNEKVLP